MTNSWTTFYADLSKVNSGRIRQRLKHFGSNAFFRDQNDVQKLLSYAFV